MMNKPLSMHEPIGFHPLEGPLLKIGRAKEHFDTLGRDCAAFMEDEPCTWRTEFEDRPDEHREYRVYAEVEKEPPIELGLVAGDVVQNLRAALDQLVWGISASDKRGRRTAFPIFLNEQAYRANSDAMIDGVVEGGRTLIKRWQPYQWGEGASDHPLAMLQQLSNLDKHRTLLPVAVARRNEFVAGYGEFKIEEFTDHRRSVPIWDEARVMSFVTSGEPPDQVMANAYLTFELTIEGRTLTDFESMFIYIGTEIIGSFDRG